MRGNIIQEDIKEQLKMGLFSYWNSYGINPKQAKYAGELKDWWRWYGMKPIPMF